MPRVGKVTRDRAACWESQARASAVSHCSPAPVGIAGDAVTISRVAVPADPGPTGRFRPVDRKAARGTVRQNRVTAAWRNQRGILAWYECPNSDSPHRTPSTTQLDSLAREIVNCDLSGQPSRTARAALQQVLRRYNGASGATGQKGEAVMDIEDLQKTFTVVRSFLRLVQAVSNPPTANAKTAPTDNRAMPVLGMKAEAPPGLDHAMEELAKAVQRGRERSASAFNLFDSEALESAGMRRDKATSALLDLLGVDGSDNRTAISASLNEARWMALMLVLHLQGVIPLSVILEAEAIMLELVLQRYWSEETKGEQR